MRLNDIKTHSKLLSRTSLLVIIDLKFKNNMIEENIYYGQTNSYLKNFY